MVESVPALGQLLGELEDRIADAFLQVYCRWLEVVNLAGKNVWLLVVEGALVDERFKAIKLVCNGCGYECRSFVLQALHRY